MDKTKIKYLVMDVDGTLTDGKIYMGNNGEIMKAFSIKDGCGIQNILIPSGIIPVIITGRESDIVLNRCKEIGISDIHQGISNKLEELFTITPDFSTVAYIGDDINDIPCMIKVKEAKGITGCPKDAAKEVISFVDFVAKNKGGDGAVRNFIDWLIEL